MSKNPYPSELQDRYIVRFSDGMRDLIAKEAKKNNRSMNSEILARLEQTLCPASNPLEVEVLAEKLAKYMTAHFELKNKN